MANDNPPRIPKNFQKTPKKFPKNSPKSPKIWKNIQFPTSHLEAENPFGLLVFSDLVRWLMSDASGLVSDMLAWLLYILHHLTNQNFRNSILWSSTSKRLCNLAYPHTPTSLIKGHVRLFFSRKKSSLPSDFHVIDWKFHPTR